MSPVRLKTGLALAVAAALLGACGQKGPLQRPLPIQEDQSAYLSAPPESGTHDTISLSERRAIC
ncbi:LPS translocon maturation chaperone LptM [Pseudohongiella spirulinae]|uniref:LPS translocon maturation chaperone LptM n=1 Tax=Pseudohongiella spirulinae TaxID=1249552 RepID=UPI0009EBC058|nr:lipoprotein [Pseudohongiella spirulinae]